MIDSLAVVMVDLTTEVVQESDTDKAIELCAELNSTNMGENVTLSVSTINITAGKIAS